MTDHLLRLRPLATMITVVRMHVDFDGSRVRCETRVIVVQFDEGQPVDIREWRSMLPCSESLTDDERAEVMLGLERDLRSRRERDPRYASRRLPEAA